MIRAIVRADIPRRRVAATPRLPRGYSETDRRRAWIVRGDGSRRCHGGNNRGNTAMATNRPVASWPRLSHLRGISTRQPRRRRERTIHVSFMASPQLRRRCGGEATAAAPRPGDGSPSGGTTAAPPRPGQTPRRPTRRIKPTRLELALGRGLGPGRELRLSVVRPDRRAARRAQARRGAESERDDETARPARLYQISAERGGGVGGPVERHRRGDLRPRSRVGPSPIQDRSGRAGPDREHTSAPSRPRGMFGKTRPLRAGPDSGIHTSAPSRHLREYAPAPGRREGIF